MSKQIALLERELDVDILLRSGNRIVGLTEPGKRVMDVAQRIVHDAQGLKGMVTDFISSDRGELVIGTTHTHARYLLPGVVRRFKTAYPRVQLVMRLENEIRVAGLVTAGEVDIGIAAKPESSTAALAMLPCYEVPRSVFAPVHHPLLRERRLTLESIARYPIITFDPSLEGGRKVLDAFAKHDIPFTVAMTASDVAVIKLYLELDIGVAILPTIAFEPARDRSLRIVDASRLFESTVIHVLIRRHHYLRRYILDFLQMLAPHWDRSSIEQGVPSGDLVDTPIKMVHEAADIMLA